MFGEQVVPVEGLKQRGLGGLAPEFGVDVAGRFLLFLLLVVAVVAVVGFSTVFVEKFVAAVVATLDASEIVVVRF